MRGTASKKDFVNLTSLLAIQVGNALVPLLIVPFVILRVGAETYAEIAVTEAVSFLSLAIVLYSFEVDGAAKVSMAGPEGRTSELSRIYSEVIFSRLILFLVSSPIILTAYWLAGGQRLDLLALWLTVPLSFVFMSYWFYQGVEWNFPAAVLTLASRVLTLVAALILIDGPEDAVWVPAVIGLPILMAGFISTVFLIKSFHLKLQPLSAQAFLKCLKDGKEIFASNVSVTLYRDFNVMFLKIAGVSAPGIATYSLIEKLVKMLQAGMRPASQLFFPKVVRRLEGHAGPTLEVARDIFRFTWPQLLLAVTAVLGVSAAVWVVGKYHVQVRELLELPNVLPVAALMLPAIVFGIANFMLGTAGLNYLGRRSYFFAAVLATGVCAATTCIFLATQFGVIGGAASFLGAEVLLLILILTAYVRGSVNTKQERAD